MQYTCYNIVYVNDIEYRIFPFYTQYAMDPTTLNPRTLSPKPSDRKP